MMGVQHHTMIIYSKMSSKVTIKTTLPLKQEGILSLHSHQHGISRHHSHFFHSHHLIDHRKILSVIRILYRRNPFSCQAQASSSSRSSSYPLASHHVGTYHDLLYIDTTITYVSYYHLVVSISSLFSILPRKKTQRKHSTTQLKSNYILPTQDYYRIFHVTKTTCIFHYARIT